MSDAPPASVLAAVGAAGEPTPLFGVNGGAWLLRRGGPPDVVAKAASSSAVSAAQLAAELRIGPAVVDEVDGWLITAHAPGEHPSPVELRRPTVLRDLAALLKRLHSNPVTTISLPHAAMHESLARYAIAAGSALDATQQRAVTWAVEEARRLSEGSAVSVPCHLDVAANLLVTEHGLRLIDFEFAGYADPAQELGQLVWEAELSEQAAACLTDAYGSNVAQVAAAATWAVVTGVTWATWAITRPEPQMDRFARRTWERLDRHWALPRTALTLC